MRDRRIEITPMVEADLEEVSEIESLAQRSPWPARIFREELDRAWARIDVVRERAADGQSRVVAFCNYWLVHDEVHLLNIATHADRRGRGIGRMMMSHLIAFAGQNACRYVTLEVRRSNDVAIALYRSFGFTAVGVRPRYYAEDGEDAIVMTLELTS